MKSNKYTKTKIGEGTYGIVYKVEDEKGNTINALKKIRFENEDEGIPSTAIREISWLKELVHKNIVKLIDVLHTPKKLTLVFEYVERDLKKVIDSTVDKGWDVKTVKSFLYQLIKGIDFIHKLKIIHRDLKPQNLLISKDGIVKIADFGWARGYGIPVKNYTHEVVTLWYRPPDVLLGSKIYGTTVDIWSIGCIFAEMVTGKPLFMGKSNSDQLKKIFKIRGTPSDNYASNWRNFSEWGVNENVFDAYPEEDIKKYLPTLDSEGVDLLLKCLQLDPEKRIVAEDAWKHPYFDDILGVVQEIYK